MIENIENIKLLEVIAGISLRQQIYTDRGSNAFVYKVSGHSDYTFGKRVISLRAGEVLFIPKGSDYRVEQISRGESRYVLINFEGEYVGAVPRVYSLEGFGDEGMLGTAMARLWLFGSTGERYKCTAVFYNLLSFLAKKESVQYAHTRRMSVIEPAAALISSGDCESIKQVAACVGYSDQLYFSRLFVRQYGCSPSNYQK